MRVFDGPVRAAKCAIGLCEALKVIDLEIRSGFNFGQVEWIDSDTIGKSVNLSARVMELASANQIYAARDQVDVLSGSGIVTKKLVLLNSKNLTPNGKYFK